MLAIPCQFYLEESQDTVNPICQDRFYLLSCIIVGPFFSSLLVPPNFSRPIINDCFLLVKPLSILIAGLDFIHCGVIGVNEKRAGRAYLGPNIKR